jgi:signal peptidase II
VERLGRRGAAILFVTAAAVYVLDRLTKLWAEHALADHPIEVIRGALTLRFTTNSGGAFSLGTSAPWLFAGASFAVSILIVVTASRHRSVLACVATGLILGGALGNLTDRVTRAPGLRGEVIDFVDPHIWPIFNAADACIVVGALLLALAGILGDRQERRAAEVSDGA